MLVAGRDTLTPLSIGLFGGWGTGKSYFMARLEERVAALSATDTEQRLLRTHRAGPLQRLALQRSQHDRQPRRSNPSQPALWAGRGRRHTPRTPRAGHGRDDDSRRSTATRRARAESAASSETALRDALDCVRREADEEARRKQADLAATARAIEDAAVAPAAVVHHRGRGEGRGVATGSCSRGGFVLSRGRCSKTRTSRDCRAD